ncbi:MAG TPA: retropepsin-like aspartic protease [Allosphingosinicella sp.]
MTPADPTRRAVLHGLAAAALLRGTQSSAQAAPAATARVESVGRRLAVRAAVGGTRLTLAIDTGGSDSLLRADVARALRLPTVGQRELHTGGRAGAFEVVEARQIALDGTIGIGPQRFALAGPETELGDGIDGTLGGPFVRGHDHILDLDGGAWRFYAGGLPSMDGWTRIDGGIVAGSPYLYAGATIDGRLFRLALDTGMPTATRLLPQATRRSGLLASERWAPAAPQGRGRLVRATRLDLAGLTLDRPLVDLQTSGIERSVYGDGLLGLPVLRRFNLAVDAHRSALWLKPNALPPQPERYDRAGLWLDRAGNGIRIGAVAPASPAGAAGLEVGDRIEGAVWKDLLDRLEGPAGSAVPLTVERNGKVTTVTLVLADYL